MEEFGGMAGVRMTEVTCPVRWEVPLPVFGEMRGNSQRGWR